MNASKLVFMVAVLLLVSGCGKSTDFWKEQMKSADSVARVHAVHALQEKTREPEKVVPVLVEGLKDPDTFIRRDSARALAKFGPAAGQAVPSLFLCLRDREPSVRKAAALALKKIDGSAAARAGLR